MSANDNLTPTSELEAINTILDAAGQGPIESLDEAQLYDEQSALRALMAASRYVQSREWEFNSAKEILVSRDENNHITKPIDALKFDISKCEQMTSQVRGGRLWNVARQSFEWDKDMLCDVSLMFPIKDLPEYVITYIMVRASRRYVKTTLGNSELGHFDKLDEDDAYSNLRVEDNRAGGRNTFNAASFAELIHRSA